MKKSNNKTWKRIAAGALSLALVAGALPANVGGLLTGGKGIVAYAETTTVTFSTSTDGKTINKDGVTCNTSFDNYNNMIAGGTFSVSSGVFTKIEVTAMDTHSIGEDSNHTTIAGWSSSSNSATWTGNSSTVQFGSIIGNSGNVTIVFTIELAAGEPEQLEMPATVTIGAGNELGDYDDTENETGNKVTVAEGQEGLTYTAVPDTNSGYIFDHWEFEVEETSMTSSDNPLNSDYYSNPPTNVVAYFVYVDKSDLETLYAEAFTYFGSNQGTISDNDTAIYERLTYAIANAEGVLDDPSANAEAVEVASAWLSEAYEAAQRVVDADKGNLSNLEPDENGVVKLDKDYRITGEIGLSENCTTLDLNGHALYLGPQQSLNIERESFTITDSSEDGTGYLGSCEDFSINVYGGTVTINGGTFGGKIYTNATLNINGGTFNDTIRSGMNSSLNITGGIFNGEISPDINGTVSIKGGTFKAAPSDNWLAPGYKVVEPGTGYVYYDVVSRYTAEIEDNLYDDCDINLYAEDGQSFKTTVTVKSDEVFQIGDALGWLGIQNVNIEVKDYDVIDPENAPTIATIAVTTGEITENGDNYELKITFTATPVYTTIGDSAEHIYTEGRGSVDIGGMTVNVNVAKREAASEEAEIAASGLTALSFTYNENNEEVTESYTKRQLSKIVGGIAIPAESTVTLTTKHKSWFTYNDGFVLEIADINEAKNADGTYTYTFTMPGYDVYHDFEKYTFTDNTFWDADSNPETADASSIVGDITYDTDDSEFYYGTDVTLNSNHKLVLTDDNGNAIEATETKTTANDVTTYTYTFKVTSNVNADLYEHQHDYAYKVEDNQLIRTCKLKDDYCKEENSDTPIAELELVTDFPEGASSYVYDGTAKSVTVNGSLINGVTVTAGTTEYFKADAFGDAISDGLENAPVNAGKYLATNTVWYDINGDTIKDEDEEFELSINFEIKPKNINDESVNFNVSNAEEIDGVFNVQPNENIPNVGPNVSLSDTAIDNTNLTNGIDKDYVITGTTSTTKFGTYKAEVTGIGNYTGSREFTWQYGDGDVITLTKDIITVNTQYNNGYAQATVNVNNVPNENYYVLGETAVNAGGTYKLKVVGIDSTGLSGTVEIDWVVDEVQLSGKNADMKKVTYLESDNKKLEFRANMAVPEGATMTKIGVFATDNAECKYQLNFNDTPVQNDDVFVKEYTDDLAGKKTSSYTWRKKNVRAGDTWYAVPYVCYTDVNGNAVTAYGDLIKATVDDNGKATYEKVEIGQAKFKSASYNASTKKLEFVNRMIIPEGCTMKAIGICATTNQAKSADLSINTAAVNGETYIKAYTDDLEGKTASNYTWRKTSVKAGDIWYVKPYVTYTDADGATYTAYGALETVTAGQEATANAELS